MRSRTAEAIFNASRQYHARAAGTASTAKVKISSKTLIWADLIFVMEEKQLTFIEKRFTNEIVNKKILTLGITDNYYYLESGLLELIRTKVEHYLKR
jgi:predicted protein tyrosine phosphatase